MVCVCDLCGGDGGGGGTDIGSSPFQLGIDRERNLPNPHPPPSLPQTFPNWTCQDVPNRLILIMASIVDGHCGQAMVVVGGVVVER